MAARMGPNGYNPHKCGGLINHPLLAFCTATKEAAALRQLGRYPYPGNVRELRNLLEQARLLCARGNLIGPRQLALEAGSTA